jgi:hypothetical protein
MKKLLSLAPAKILILCGAGFLVTLGAFWHYQSNQSQLDRMNVLNQGVATCFNRISQTFTAMMIKEVQSPYLNRGFMGLSDECLNETIRGINPFRQNVGKGFETLNKLIGEVHWFHEKVLKIHGPWLSNQNIDTPLSPLSDRFTKMENLKVTLVDEIDAASARLREVQANDEILMGLGLLLFVLGLSVLSMQEFNRLQVRRDIESEALNLLRSGKANVGAMVDSLLDRALASQGMPVTAQIFKDYHEEILERMAHKVPVKKETPETEKLEDVMVAPVKLEEEMPKASLKEILVSIQNVHSSESMQLNDVRDVWVAHDNEACEQIINAAVSKLAEKRIAEKKIMISNQIHSDRSIINFFLAGNTFNATELEFAGDAKGLSAEGGDMNLLILKEMAQEAGVQLSLENKTDRHGSITGMAIRLTMKRVPKNKAKNLVSVMKGKKKDLARELMN